MPSLAVLELAITVLLILNVIISQLFLLEDEEEERPTEKDPRRR